MLLQHPIRSSIAVAWITVNTLVAGAPTSFRRNPSNSPRPYTIDVSQSRIEEIRQKAASFKPSQDIEQPAWADGPPSSEMASLAHYWAEDYDWFAVQSHINEDFDHYMTTIPSAGGNYTDPLDIHFIH